MKLKMSNNVQGPIIANTRSKSFWSALINTIIQMYMYV